MSIRSTETDTPACNLFHFLQEMLDKRLNDKGKNWRHVFKGLTLLDYLLHAGSENCVLYFQYVALGLNESATQSYDADNSVFHCAERICTLSRHCESSCISTMMARIRERMVSWLNRALQQDDYIRYYLTD